MCSVLLQRPAFEQKIDLQNQEFNFLVFSLKSDSAGLVFEKLIDFHSNHKIFCHFYSDSGTDARQGDLCFGNDRAVTGDFLLVKSDVQLLQRI